LNGSKLIPRQERLKPLIKDYYALLDRGLADLINAAGKETTVLFMSDHGFGPLKKKFYINSWLQQKGWLSYDADLVRRVNRKKSFKAILKQYLMRFPVVQEFIARRGTLPLRKRMQAYQFLDFIHWSRTQAFSVSNTEQGIYINLKGREPQGVINPGKEYETLRDTIMDALRSLHNPENGQPLVSHLYKKEDLYQGPYMNHAPDIVFFLGEGEYLADVRLTDYLWEDLSWITGRGTHRKDGLFIAYGNGVRKGINVEANIVDLAPTVLFLLNRPIPEDIDGSILTSVFEPDFLSARTPQFEAVMDTMEEGLQPFSLSQEEEKKVFSNLKDLGYM
ncbi:MAG: alkaline phosphatase family protein, partial [Proteobacteria bacterium]|nr:alkaline phosphatase family protein [Pseudomonadota bacterium]